jgi:hypothetical protein
MRGRFDERRYCDCLIRSLYLFEAASLISAIGVSAVRHNHVELRPCAKQHTNTSLRQLLLF